MTPVPDNLPERNSKSPSSELESINNLLDLLLDSNSSPKETSKEKKVANEHQKSESHNLSSDGDELNLDYTDVENLTLNQAVEYEAFLQQTVDPKDNSDIEINRQSQAVVPKEELISQTLSSNQEQKTREEKIQPASKSLELDTNKPKSPATELDPVDLVNALIPLIVELVKYKIDESQESIIKTVTPVLDRIIEQRTLEDSPKMAAAIAKILPHAIAEGMNLSPEAIAKAIAPELALCITEQIRLDENAISEALGSEMGKAIKTQIELEKDAMVDALYPVIGSTISKYMVEVVQDINRKVDNTLSREGIKRKIRAKIQGVSEAELIFRESIGYYVQAVFLIDKDSGIVIQEIKRAEDQHLDSGMIAGMLTAIRSFANDCIASSSELDEIDYGDCQIPIEVAGYCYLAVVVKGEPTKEFRTRIRRVLGEIVLNYGDAISNYQGDMATVPPQIKLRLAELLEEKSQLQKMQQSSYSSMLLWLLIFIFSLIFIPWGIINHRADVAHNIEQTVAKQLDAAPELSVYRFEPYVNRGTLTISGRVPSKYLQNQAAIITQEIATENNLQLDNQIVAIKIPPNPNSVSGEIQRLTSLLNQQPDTLITSKYNVETRTLVVNGFVLNAPEQEPIAQMFNQVPGIDKIILNINNKLPVVKELIYFNSGSSQFDFIDSFNKIDSVIKFLNSYPQLHLQLLAHNDGQGSPSRNQELDRERCTNVKAALMAKGVNSHRIVASCEEQSLAKSQRNQATWLNRYVSFEPFIPTRSTDTK